MSKFQQLYNESDTPEQKEELLKQGVRAVLREEKKEAWAAVLKSEYGIFKGGAKEVPFNRYSSYYKIIAVAASLLLLVFVGQRMYDTQEGPTSLAMSYLQNEEIQHPGVTKGQTDVYQAFRQDAIKAFDTGNYKGAIEQFDQISELTNEDRFYLGVSLLHAKEYSRAIKEFDFLLDVSTIYSEEINWYYSLALILKGDIERAKVSLLGIDSNGWNYDKAEVLLKSLK